MSVAEETVSKEIIQLRKPELIVFSTTEEALTKLRQRFAHLTSLEKIDGGRKSDTYKKVKAALSELTALRSAATDEHKIQKSAALEHGRKCDSMKNHIHEELKKIEFTMRVIKKTVDDEDDRIKQEKIDAEEKRIEHIRDRITAIVDYKDIDINNTKASYIKNKIKELSGMPITVEEFEEFTTEAQTESSATLAILEAKLVKREQCDTMEKERKAEADRLAKQKEAQEAAQKKLDDERAEFEQKQREAQEKEDAKKREKETQERERLAAEKAQQDERDRIKKEQEDKETKERLDREAEEHRVAMLPDKEKLLEFYNSLYEFWNDIKPMESLSSNEAKNLLAEATETYTNTVAGLIKKSKKL